MARLIQVDNVSDLPARVIVQVGDVLAVTATGGRARSSATPSTDVVQVLGPFVQGLVGANGQLLVPAGPPNAVFFVARHPGEADIDVVTGDPWGAVETSTFRIIVEE